ncbi:glycosyltransferase [Carboxylicivirga sp. N1E11]|uniref:glycosyltransferase n=1 Tax=Carboxylicivirga longa TaxID=3134029 RepID=UPI003D32EE50
MKRKKKVCLVIHSMQAGGMERVMAELASYFSSQENIETHLVLYGISRQIFYDLPNNVIIHKPKFKFNNNKRLYSTLQTVLYIRKVVVDINPDATLSFGEYWNSLVLIALLGKRTPLFISDRCQPNKSFGKLHDKLRKWLYPLATGVIAQTEKAKQIYHTQFNHNNIRVIGNPIRKIEKRGDVGRQNIVLMVGRLIKTKHHDKLIEMFINIANPHWKLVIVGYDHQKQKNSENLKRIIARSNAQDRITLAGKQSDVEAYYLSSKIFAFTSSSEGFPNVIGEAQSAGLPVIAFDCIAGPSEMINDGENGFLIPLFNYREFEEKLRALMENEEMRRAFGKKGRIDIVNFSIDKIGAETLNFILPN